MNDIAPVDPDIALMVDYLANALSPQEEAQVEARLVDDAAFFEKVVPVARIWLMPVSFRELMARYPKEEAPMMPQPVPAHGVLDFPTKARLRRRQWWGDLSATAKAMILGATAAGILLGVPTVSMMLLTEQRENAAAVGSGHAPTADLRRGTTIVTPPVTQSRTIVLEDSSRIMLGPNSSFKHEAQLVGQGTAASLEGEAAIEVSRKGNRMLLRTAVGRVILLPGTYAVRCAVGCTEMVVSVGTGVAAIEGDSTVKRRLLATEGKHARVKKGGNPELTEGTEYPVPPAPTGISGHVEKP